PTRAQRAQEAPAPAEEAPAPVLDVPQRPAEAPERRSRPTRDRSVPKSLDAIELPAPRDEEPRQPNRRHDREDEDDRAARALDAVVARTSRRAGREAGAPLTDASGRGEGRRAEGQDTRTERVLPDIAPRREDDLDRGGRNNRR